VIRKSIVNHAGAAWLAAVAGAWLVAVACRTLQGGASLVAAPLPGAGSREETGGVRAPTIRVGILTDVDHVTIAAAAGIEVRGRAPGEPGMRLRSLPRATFRPGAPGRIRLLETGDELDLAMVATTDPSQLLKADATSYRGLMEVRPADTVRLTVVNTVQIEDYVRGVVPNELSPEEFPRLEALKAQAVAARTYALAHVGDYAAKGYDVCATAACQVYHGQSSEHPLTDRAVAETRGIVATWRGRPINAYYTSTCGGHTEDGAPILDDDAPYLRGVACPSEAPSRRNVKTKAAPRRDLPGGPETARALALLESLGVVSAAEAQPARLRRIPGDAEVRAWTAGLQAALRLTGCESPVSGSLARRATFARHLVASACWSERAVAALADGAAPGLPAEDAAKLDGDGERQAVAFLLAEGLLSSGPDEALRPNAALTRAEMLRLLAGAAAKAGAPDLAEGEVTGLGEGEISLRRGDRMESHPLDAAARLFRAEGGLHSTASELTLDLGDRVLYVVREGRVVYLEAEQGRPDSPYCYWQVRLTPAQVARAINRYGSVGQVRDIVPRRLGVSGRVVELGVIGSDGQIELKGLRVRSGLGLRESLFVVSRERGPRGDVERFVISGKGWGHGVGLCQVGAFGMARAGSTFEEILKHYYTGISLTRDPSEARIDSPRPSAGHASGSLTPASLTRLASAR